MKKDITPNERIDAYLLNQLPKAERKVLENDIKKDQQLAQQFQQQEMEHKMMESLIEDDLFKNLKQWQTEADNTQTNVRPLVATTARTATTKRIPLYRRSSFLAIAASFLLLLVAAIWVFQPENTVTEVAEVTEPTDPTTTPVETTDPTEQLAETIQEEVPPTPEPTPQEQVATTDVPQNETPPEPKPERNYKIENTSSQPNYMALAASYDSPIDFTNVRSTEEQESPYNMALAQLRSGDFAAAITNLKTTLAADAENLNARYYLGLAFYESKDFKQAIPYLKAVAADAYYLENEEAQWRLGLAYLQDKQVEPAKAIFTEISGDEEHSFYKEAVEILGKL